MKLIRDPILQAFLDRYFKLLKQERIGETPELTLEIDVLEAEIKKRKHDMAVVAGGA